MCQKVLGNFAEKTTSGDYSLRKLQQLASESPRPCDTLSHSTEAIEENKPMDFSEQSNEVIGYL